MIKRTGKRPAAAEEPEAVAKSPSKKGSAELLSTTAGTATAKLTVSIKRRLANGDEVFIAPGVEKHVSGDQLDAAQAEVTERVHAWMTELLERYPDASADELETDNDEEDEPDAEEAEAEEDELTEEMVAAMKKPELLALIEEQELEIDGAAKMKIGDLRTAVTEALFSDDDDADEDADEDEDADDDTDEDSDDDEAEGEEGYTSEELNAMKLAALQEICTEWDIGDPKLAKGADVKAKKAAYIKHILAAQDEE